MTWKEIVRQISAARRLLIIKRFLLGSLIVAMAAIASFVWQAQAVQVIGGLVFFITVAAVIGGWLLLCRPAYRYYLHRLFSLLVPEYFLVKEDILEVNKKRKIAGVLFLLGGLFGFSILLFWFIGAGYIGKINSWIMGQLSDTYLYFVIILFLELFFYFLLPVLLLSAFWIYVVIPAYRKSDTLLWKKMLLAKLKSFWITRVNFSDPDFLKASHIKKYYLFSVGKGYHVSYSISACRGELPFEFAHIYARWAALFLPGSFHGLCFRFPLKVKINGSIVFYPRKPSSHKILPRLPQEFERIWTERREFSQSFSVYATQKNEDKELAEELLEEYILYLTRQLKGMDIILTIKEEFLYIAVNQPKEAVGKKLPQYELWNAVQHMEENIQSQFRIMTTVVTGFSKYEMACEKRKRKERSIT